MTEPGSGGRPRHSSPARQPEPLLPVTSPLANGGGSPTDATSPEPAWGRRGREGTAVAAAARRGGLCTAAGLLAVALVLSIGLLALRERAESKRDAWTSFYKQRAALRAGSGGNAAPYIGVASPGAAMQLGNASAEFAAALDQALAAKWAGQQAEWQQEAEAQRAASGGAFPACPAAGGLPGAGGGKGQGRNGGRRREPPRSFIFNELSVQEIAQVEAALVKELGLWQPGGGGGGFPRPHQDFVAVVEALPPPKSEAVAWLGGGARRPARFARATVVRGSRPTPDVQEFQVGPLEKLSKGQQPEIVPLWRDGQIPWTKHPLGHYSLTWLRAIVLPVAYELRGFFRNFTGGAACYGAPATGKPPAGDRCDFVSFAHVPFQGWSPPGKRWTHIKFLFRPRSHGGDEAHLFPVPITFQVDESSPRLEDWRVQNIEYCNQGPFASAAELIAAEAAGNLTHCRSRWGEKGYDSSWASTAALPGHAGSSGGTGAAAAEAGTAEAAFAARASARSYMPHGSRVTVDPAPEGTGAAFAWGEWSGHAKVAASSGLALHDLRFRGERIVFELALQELQVVYNGFGGGGQIFLMDGYIGIGATSEALRRGHDCPAHATFVPVVAVNSRWNGRHAPVAALCLFEEDAGVTEWRHSIPRGMAAAQVDSVRSVSLVIRTIATLGNYDYSQDVRLRLDGSIDVRLVAGGYMSTLFWQGGATDEEAAFGTVVHDDLLAPLHDHLAGWKLDLDVAGRNNSFQTQTVRVGSYEQALAASAASAKTAAKASPAAAEASRRSVRRQQPGWHSAGPDVVKYVETARPGAELGLRLNGSAPAVWQFVSERENAFGSPRGYAISITGPTTQQLLPASHPLLGAAAWTKYHLAVTVQRDDEPASVATRLDGYHPEAPAVSLDNFIDGENTDNVDLVAWVMVGLQHLPRSEDIPVVPNMCTGFSLKPWNYFDGLPSRHVREAAVEEKHRCAPET